MLLKLATTKRPATDLGFLLHKNPARAQSFDFGFGHVHVSYQYAATSLPGGLEWYETWGPR